MEMFSVISKPCIIACSNSSGPFFSHSATRRTDEGDGRSMEGRTQHSPICGGDGAAGAGGGAGAAAGAGAGGHAAAVVVIAVVICSDHGSGTGFFCNLSLLLVV